MCSYIDFKKGPGVSRGEILDALGFSSVKIDISVAEQNFFLYQFGTFLGGVEANFLSISADWTKLKKLIAPSPPPRIIWAAP